LLAGEDMLKILKIQINLDVKGDPSDEFDLRDRVYEALQFAMEDEELEFTFEEDEDEMDIEE
jgi:hypothetical protein